MTIVSPSESQAQWVNAAGLTEAEFAEVQGNREVARAIGSWMSEQRAASGRATLFDRRAYTSPTTWFDDVLLARKAVKEDDMVGGVADVTEGLIFQGMKWESPEADDADIFNQISAELDLDGFLRAAYRELFTCGQVVVASWWGPRQYRVSGYAPAERAEGQTPVTGQSSQEEPLQRGRRRRKQYDLIVPTRLTILDSTKVLPVQGGIWGRERLVWLATPQEMEVWESDPTMDHLILGKYEPTQREREELGGLSINPEHLLLMNPDRVWRHCNTKPEYERWPDVRIKSVFRLLDLKQQLLDADRVALVGNINYLILVKKGSKERPALQEEVDQLNEEFATIAKLPVIVSDNRLEIEILAPDQSSVLNTARYDTIDKRIMSRLFGALTASSTGQRNESTLTVARMVGRLLESRRHMLKRAIEANFARRISEVNPDKFSSQPSLTYFPNKVELDTDSAIVQAIVGARARNELSRESYLEFLGYDQEVEMQRRIEESQSGADEIFQTRNPFDSPQNNQLGNGQDSAQNTPGGTGSAGGQGGRPPGGGKPTQNATQPGKGKQ